MASTSLSFQPRAIQWYFAAVFVTLLCVPVAAHWVDDDLVTAISSSEIPKNSILCPGGYWSVAVTTFGVQRGTFGKAKPKDAGGVEAYFSYGGKERSINKGESLDLLVFPTSGKREYSWVTVKEYYRRRERYRVVKKGGYSPFSYYHPGDGALWQVGKVDLEHHMAEYTVDGNTMKLRQMQLETGKVLVIADKEYSFMRAKKIMMIVLAIFLNIMAFTFLLPFFPRRFRFRLNARAMRVCRREECWCAPVVKPRLEGPICVQTVQHGCKDQECPPGRKSLCEAELDVRLLHEVIGTGAFGVVEKATLGDRKVAVKFINPMNNCSCDETAMSTIAHEMKVLERVSQHENVVHCFGQYIDENKRVGIVEELMEMNMYDWMHSENFREKTTMMQLLEVFIDITKGLEHLHKCGVVHYDLKPKNVLLDNRLSAKVADFGCSKIKASSYITAGFCGTLGYIAPECILSMYCNLRSKVRAEKIDVFSLGVVMWEALVGFAPDSGGGGDNLDFSFGSRLSKDSTTDMVGEVSPSQQSSASLNMSMGQLNNCLMAKFPITGRCPQELRDLVASCMDVSNRSRPTCKAIRRHLEGMRSQPWAGHAIQRAIG